jgi:hypothetical protein
VTAARYPVIVRRTMSRLSGQLLHPPSAALYAAATFEGTESNGFLTTSRGAVLSSDDVGINRSGSR